jgi:cell division control protein 45
MNRGPLKISGTRLTHFQSEFLYIPLRLFYYAHVLISINRLTESLGLAKSVHRAVVRTGSSVIDKNDIRVTRGCSIATLRQGPDVELFTHPGALARLGFWLTDVLRDRIQGSSMSRRSRHKSIPLLISCHNERAKTYMVVGINAALDFGDTLKKFVFFYLHLMFDKFNNSFSSEFGHLFVVAKDELHAQVRHGSFEPNIMEVHEDDYDKFVAEVNRAKDRH